MSPFRESIIRAVRSVKQQNKNETSKHKVIRYQKI